MDINELGAREYYYNKVCGFWIDKCTNGEILEEELEDKVNYFTEKSAIQLKRIWQTLLRNEAVREK